MKYRPEIDGLRAVAVVPVVLFHSGYQSWQGGFVGVDVFFVISGYLITSNILGGLQDSSFSILSFYERRVRRLLPALFFTCLVCLPFAWVWMTPSEMKDFSQSLISVTTFSSNFLFWKESGYFSPDSGLKPLLHTWSLAVEEQFYLVFPALLVMIRTVLRWRMIIMIAATTILSFLIAEWSSTRFMSAGFYLLPMRAWELGAGSLIAVCFDKPIASTKISQTLSVAGLLLIAGPMAFLDASFPFPGRWALLPVIGTALVIICARNDEIVSRILKAKILVGVGLISYSLYLVHQPVLAFAKMRYLDDIPKVGLVALNVLMGGLAYAMWRFIEGPFRKTGGDNARVALSAACLVSVVFLTIGVAGHLLRGFPLRGPDISDLSNRFAINQGLSGECDGPDGFPLACRTSEVPEVIVWGDSYAMHLVDAILASNPEARLVQATKSRCGPLGGIAPVSGSGYFGREWAEGCITFNERVRKYIEETPSIKYALLSSRFSQYLSPEAGLLADGVVRRSTQSLVIRRFVATLEWLKSVGITPVVVSPPPSSGQDLGACTLRVRWLELKAGKCELRWGDVTREQKEVLAFIEKVRRDYKFVLLHERLCDEERCATEIGGTYIYRDSGHLSHEGSAAIGKDIDLYRTVTGNRS